MKCYVYILYSITKEKYYVGVSNDIVNRLHRHNSGESLSTKHGIPWILVHAIECDNKSAAIVLEIKIKKRGIKRFLDDNNIFPG